MDAKKILKVALFTPGIEGWGLPMCFWGAPGIGKSRRITDVSRLFGLVCHVLIASIRDPADFCGLPIPVKRGRKTFVEYTPAGWAADLEVEGDGRGLVFLDEITTCPPAVQAALLRLVLEKALGDHKLPRGIRLVSAANEVSVAAGGHELALPLLNRFGHVKWDVPDVSSWVDWLIGSNGGPVASETSAQEEEARVMRLWPGAFASAKGLVSGFLKARPDLLFKMPEVGSGMKAWPSPRTWEMTVRAIGGCRVHGIDEVHTDEMISSFVGAGPAAELTAFRSNVDLPEPADLLDGRVKFEHEAARLDRTVAVLSACSALVCGTKCDKRAERVEALWRIVEAVADRAADLTVPAARALVMKRLHLGSAASKAALVKLQPILAAANVRPS